MACWNKASEETPGRDTDWLRAGGCKVGATEVGSTAHTAAAEEEESSKDHLADPTSTGPGQFLKAVAGEAVWDYAYRGMAAEVGAGYMNPADIAPHAAVAVSDRTPVPGVGKGGMHKLLGDSRSNSHSEPLQTAEKL